MSDALLAGVSGLQAHQTMLDVAGNNLSNVNTYGFKSGRVTFSELLAQTLREATQPTGVVGGTNPQQIGSGVRVASVDHNMAQGNLVYTGQPLDMSVDGGGYFVLNDGQKDVYTRSGSFAVDASFYLVNPNTGYRVQRIGSEGVAEGFQEAASDHIRVPYDIPLAAQISETITFTGNLSASTTTPTTSALRSDVQYTVDERAALRDSLLADLDQAQGVAAGDTIRITGTTRDGAAVNTVFTLAADSTLGDLLDAIGAAFPGSQAGLSSGQVTLTDTEAGYSRTDLGLAYSGGGTLELPPYFKIAQAGGEETRNTNIDVFDAQGISHNLAVAFVRTDAPNTWDAVLLSVTGDVTLADRRVTGITFGPNGAFTGLGGASPDEPSFRLEFASDPGNERVITLDLGTEGEFDGLTQVGGQSTAAANGQDGYEAGYLSSVSVSREGVLVGMFTNGIRRTIAALKLATFQNPAGLQSVGNGFFTASANSGDPVPTRALAGGAGSVQGGALEKSNVDMAAEFVGLIQAQNGYQANARTIRVASDMLRELATLIR
ncbi:MAG: flagellar hook-basal body complex protein [Planctomycetes bacterium]|nr:flagellar hook-basal body complex protein [Planctomycetota bacterium]